MWSSSFSSHSVIDPSGALYAFMRWNVKLAEHILIMVESSISAFSLCRMSLFEIIAVPPPFDSSLIVVDTFCLRRFPSLVVACRISWRQIISALRLLMKFHVGVFHELMFQVIILISVPWSDLVFTSVLFRTEVESGIVPDS